MYIHIVTVDFSLYLKCAQNKFSSQDKNQKICIDHMYQQWNADLRRVIVRFEKNVVNISYILDAPFCPLHTYITTIFIRLESRN